MNTRDLILGLVLAGGSAYALTTHDSQPGPASDDNYTSAEATVFDPAPIELPNDGKRWALIIATHKDYSARPREREVLRWFSGGNRRLTEFKSQVDFFHYTDDDPMWQTRFRPKYGGRYPIVVVQDWSAAKRIYLPRNRLPKTSKQTVSTIRRELREMQATDEKDLWKASSMLGQCPDGQCRPGRFLPRPWRIFFRRPRPQPDDNDDEDSDDGILPNLNPLNRDEPMRETGNQLADSTAQGSIDPNLLYPGAIGAGLLGAYALRRKE